MLENGRSSSHPAPSLTPDSLPASPPATLARCGVGKWGWTLLLMAAALVVYSPALRNGFVWDDTALVLRDPFIRSWRLIPEGFGHFLFADATASDFYRPMQRLLFTFDYAVFGFAPRGYHLMSILLHGAAAVALYFLLLELIPQTLRGRMLAGIAGLLWVIHPLHTSAVTYVAGSADLLAAFFGFAALKMACLSGRTRGSNPPPDHRDASRVDLTSGIAAALLFLAAMLSKESGSIFLVVWLAWTALRRDGRRLAMWAGIAVAVAGTALFLRLHAAHEVAPRFAALAAPSERPALILKAMGEYARLAFAPVDLHMERTLGAAAFDGRSVLGLLAVAGLLLWAWRIRRARLLLAAAILAYLPMSNLFALNAHVAEHWLYVPLAFLLGAAAVSLEPFRSRQNTLAIVVGLWGVWLGGRTFVRNFDWRDQRTFVERTIAAGGDSARMQMARASLEMGAGNLPGARKAAERALELAPGHPFGWLRLAGIAILEKNHEEARALLERLGTEPFFASERLIDLAAIARSENSEAYLPLLQQAAELSPDDWNVQKRYATALWKSGAREAARERLNEILQRQPYRAETWEMLGRFLRAEGLAEEAEKAFAEASLRDMHWRRPTMAEDGLPK